MSNPNAKAPTIREFIHDSAILDFGDMSQEEVNRFIENILNSPPPPFHDMMYGAFPFGPPSSGKTMFGLEILKSRHCPPGKAFMVDLGKIEMDMLSAFLPGPFYGARRPRDTEKLDAVRSISARFLEEARGVLAAIDERRRREQAIAQHEQALRDYEEDQRDYAEDKAPAMLANVPPNIVDMGERMAQAVEMAKALYRTMNAAPVHPFPPVPVDHEAEQQAKLIRGTDIARQAAEHLLDMGADKAEIPVVVNGVEYLATITKQAPRQLEACAEVVAKDTAAE